MLKLLALAVVGCSVSAVAQPTFTVPYTDVDPNVAACQQGGDDPSGILAAIGATCAEAAEAVGCDHHLEGNHYVYTECPCSCPGVYCPEEPTQCGVVATGAAACTDVIDSMGNTAAAYCPYTCKVGHCADQCVDFLEAEECAFYIALGYAADGDDNQDYFFHNCQFSLGVCTHKDFPDYVPLDKEPPHCPKQDILNGASCDDLDLSMGLDEGICDYQGNDLSGQYNANCFGCACNEGNSPGGLGRDNIASAADFCTGLGFVDCTLQSTCCTWAEGTCLPAVEGSCRSMVPTLLEPSDDTLDGSCPVDGENCVCVMALTLPSAVKSSFCHDRASCMGTYTYTCLDAPVSCDAQCLGDDSQDVCLNENGVPAMYAMKGNYGRGAMVDCRGCPCHGGCDFNNIVEVSNKVEITCIHGKLGDVVCAEPVFPARERCTEIVSEEVTKVHVKAQDHSTKCEDPHPSECTCDNGKGYIACFNRKECWGLGNKCHGEEDPNACPKGIVTTQEEREIKCEISAFVSEANCRELGRESVEALQKALNAKESDPCTHTELHVKFTVTHAKTEETPAIEAQAKFATELSADEMEVVKNAFCLKVRVAVDDRAVICSISSTAVRPSTSTRSLLTVSYDLRAESSEADLGEVDLTEISDSFGEDESVKAINGGSSPEMYIEAPSTPVYVDGGDGKSCHADHKKANDCACKAQDGSISCFDRAKCWANCNECLNEEDEHLEHNQKLCSAHCVDVGCGAAYSAERNCQCDSTCTKHGDCCPDYDEQCQVCAETANGCHEKSTSPGADCYCDAHCKEHGDCCFNHEMRCNERCEYGCHYEEGRHCQCDKECEKFGDCCTFGYAEKCASCAGVTSNKDDLCENFQHDRPCQCDAGCQAAGDCCADVDFNAGCFA